MRKPTACLVFLSALVPALAAAAPTWPTIKKVTSWEFVADRDHDDAGIIKVHMVELDGIKCLRGRALTPGTAATYLAVSTDIRGSKHWSTAGLKESEILKDAGSVLEYYQYLDVPGWTGASDRFWFLRGTKETSGSVLSFSWDRMGERGGPHSARFDQVMAANPDAIEPPLNVGGWTFEQKGADVESSYYVCSDTGGVLPMAIQYAAAKKTLPDTIGDLVREAKKRSK